MKNKLAIRGYSFAILLAAVSVAVLAQQQGSLQSDASAAKLRQHITYLASDALEGRRTGSAGATDAAHYIAGEFSRLGLRPAAQKAGTPRKLSEAMSRYLQTFPYVAGVEPGKGNMMSIATPAGSSENLRISDDWMPLGISANGRVDKAEYLFVGYGITAAELNYNNYGPVSKERIAVALSGTPDGDNPHGQFARYEDPRWKAIAARNAGAKALLLIAQEDTFKEDRLSRLRYDNAGDAGIPVAVISKQAATKLFSSSTDTGQMLAALVEEAKVSKSGLLTSAKTTSLSIKGMSLNCSIDVVRREVPAYNVAGILDGSDPVLKKETIIIGAHYDHLGRGGEGSLAPREGEIHHGADDNASGVAGVLELARVFTTQRARPKRTIMFIAFSGEEEGLLGSNYYVNHPLVPLGTTIAMINMDMIGRMRARKLIVGGVGTAKEWRDIIGTGNFLQGAQITATVNDTRPEGALTALPMVSSANGRTIVSTDSGKTFDLTLNEDGYGPSDHSSFYGKQIPVLFFWTGNHEDYHKPSDTADKINYDDEVRILSLVARIVRDVDNGAKRPSYTVAKSESAGRATGFRVYLGTIPNYADTNDGLLLDGVRDDSPAANAGLKAGDRIMKIAGRDVHNVYDYTYALGEMKAGQEYVIDVLRGNERLTLKITPAARK